jgi:hypothetical protein
MGTIHPHLNPLPSRERKIKVFHRERDDKKEPLEGLEEHMTKEDLLAILKKLLRTERSLDFLNGLDEEDVRTLIVCIRDRLDRESRDH